MKTSFACIPCLTRQATEAVAMSVADAARRDEILRGVLREIAGSDWNVSPPEICRDIGRRVRQATGCPDPYRLVKDRMNRMAADLLPALREQLRAQPDACEAVIRLAIGGNLLDSGAKTQIAAEDLPRHMNSIWSQPLDGNAAELFQAAERARSILYLADNAGEIVFDRVLIEALPAGRTTVVVRGAPILNDALRADAEFAGLPDLAEIRDNGSDAPGTILADCSDEFRRRFETADLVIAKGQGNWETLNTVEREVFFLLIVKCPIVADELKTQTGTLVIRRSGGKRRGA